MPEIGASDIPELIVINKIDAADETQLKQLRTKHPGMIEVSAHTGEGIDELMQAIAETLPESEHEVTVLLPYHRGDLVSRVHQEGRILSEEYTESGTVLHAWVSPELAGQLDQYATVAS